MTKILLLSTHDITGGAARASYRLHQGLLKTGANSLLLVQNKHSDDFTVIVSKNKIKKAIALVKPRLDILPLSLYPQRLNSSFSVEWLGDNMVNQIQKIDPDIINLHWIREGFIQIETLRKLNKPIVWTLHDMWAFTGGCHYTQECDHYTKNCGNCPLLNSKKEWDLSRWIWQRKAKAWKNLPLTIITPSRWLAKCAGESSLFRDFPIEVIPNGIDIHKYKPLNKQLAKNILGLSPEKTLILFAASHETNNQRKGFDLLIPAIQKFSKLTKQPEIELVIFGTSLPNNPPNFGFKVHYLGQLYDDISLALVYAAADVFIAPSLQDNLPNTVLESLACGTPCVAFKIGGMLDLIDHQKNGYLAQPFIIDDLTKGIHWILEDKQRQQKLSIYARQKVELEFNQQLQSIRYLSLFSQLSQSIKHGEKSP